jgi:uncharacterized protein (DUF736 family)
MATIGSFTSSGNGFSGSIRTLALNVKAQFRRIDSPSDKGPHFRIFAQGGVELGAAWQRVAEGSGRDYLSVKLDDPSFPAPIYATLAEVDGEEGLQLIWGADPLRSEGVIFRNVTPARASETRGSARIVPVCHGEPDASRTGGPPGFQSPPCGRRQKIGSPTQRLRRSLPRSSTRPSRHVRRRRPSPTSRRRR